MLEAVQEISHQKIDSLSIEAMKADVIPFVRDTEVVEACTKELFHAAIERLEIV